MLNVIYNGVKVVSPVNAPNEEHTPSGHGRAIGRGTSSGTVRGRMVSVMIKVSIDNVLMNEKDSAHNEEIMEQFQIEYVSEVEQQEECWLKR